MVIDVGIYGITTGTVGAQVWLTAAGAAAPNQVWVVETTPSAGMMHIVNIASGLCLDASRAPRACGAGMPGAFLPFCNTSLPLSDRVADIVGSLTPDEALGLFNTGSAGVPRLGIPPIQWWNEGLHGVANSPGTSFTR